jgi:hypothetical protein
VHRLRRLRAQRSQLSLDLLDQRFHRPQSSIQCLVHG